MSLTEMNYELEAVALTSNGKLVAPSSVTFVTDRKLLKTQLRRFPIFLPRF